MRAVIERTGYKPGEQTSCEPWTFAVFLIVQPFTGLRRLLRRQFTRACDATLLCETVQRCLRPQLNGLSKGTKHTLSLPHADSRSIQQTQEIEPIFRRLKSYRWLSFASRNRCRVLGFIAFAFIVEALWNCRTRPIKALESGFALMQSQDEWPVSWPVWWPEEHVRHSEPNRREPDGELSDGVLGDPKSTASVVASVPV